MAYVIIRRYGDDREDERLDWDAEGHNLRPLGDAWQIEGDGLRWRVTKVTAGDETSPAAIVLEPIDD